MADDMLTEDDVRAMTDKVLASLEASKDASPVRMDEFPPDVYVSGARWEGEVEWALDVRVEGLTDIKGLVGVYRLVGVRRVVPTLVDVEA